MYKQNIIGIKHGVVSMVHVSWQLTAWTDSSSSVTREDNID